MAQKTDITPSNTEEKSVYQEMEVRDERQILSEMQGTAILGEMVYDITISGKRVTNLSYSGIKEAIRRRGSLEILDVKTEETEATIRALVKVRDLQNRIDVLGASEADKSKPFAYVLAINKAERNAFAKLIPAKWFATLIDEYLQQKGNARHETRIPAQQPQQQPPTPYQEPKNVTPKATGKHLDIDPETLTVLTASTQIQDERIKQYPILPDGNNPVGMVNVLDDVLAIVPYQANLRTDHTAFTSFLFPRILDKVCNKYKCEYEVVGTSEGALLYILVKGALAEEEIKGLTTSARWAFLKAFEAKEQPTA